MQEHITKNTHERGHFALKRTEEHIKSQYIIPKLSQKIGEYIKNYVTFILANRKAG